MTTPLSTDAEAFIAKLIAAGRFATREAVLETAVRSLRTSVGEIPQIPDEHIDAVEEALAESRAGRSVEFSVEDREQIRAGILARLEAERARAAS